jgi:hypothetical protein
MRLVYLYELFDFYTSCLDYISSFVWRAFRQLTSFSPRPCPFIFRMKAKKSSRKYAASGKLKQAIQARHKHQKVKKKIDAQKARKSKNQQKGGAAANGYERKNKPISHDSGSEEDDEDEDEEDEDIEMTELTSKQKRLRMEDESGDDDEGQEKNDVRFFFGSIFIQKH